MAMCPAPRWPVVIVADEGVGWKIDLDDLPAGRGALIRAPRGALAAARDCKP